MTQAGNGPGPNRGSAGSDYVPVTVVCGDRWVDVALPSMVPWADLQPGLLRLLFADRPPRAAGRWVLTPIGRADLGLTETLSGAGISESDVVVLRQTTGAPTAPARVYSVRDQVEDIVEGHDRFWRRQQTVRLTLWTTTVGAGLLLPPIAGAVVGWPSAFVGWPGADPLGVLGAGVAGVAGFPLAGVAGAVGVIAAVTAVLAARSGEAFCAATCLTFGCGWAGLAGMAAYRASMPLPAGSMAPAPTVAPTMVAVGAAAALALAGCCVLGYAGALAHTAALLVIGGAAATVATAVVLGAPGVETACAATLLSVLAIGVIPRAVLAVSGVSGLSGGGDGEGGGGEAGARDVDPAARLTERVARADRLLTGSVVGMSVVAVGGAMRFATSDNPWYQMFGGGIGLALLLRSRVFTQVPHVLAPRIGGLVVFAGLWVGVGSAHRLPVALLVLGPMVGLAVAVLVVTLTPGASPVANARIGRALDLAELTLVATLVVLAAGLLGGAGWVTDVIV